MKDLSIQEQNELYEAHCAYVKAVKKLKMKGISSPERALKEFVAELEANMETITETVDIITESDKFSDYFNVGEKAGASFEEIHEAHVNRDSTFLIESSFYNGVSQKVTTMKNMGHKVRDLSVTSRGGIPHAEFVSIDKEGNRKKTIIHGNATTTANLGKVNPNDPDANNEGI